MNNATYGVAHATVEEVAADTGMTIEEARKNLKSLERKGLVISTGNDTYLVMTHAPDCGGTDNE